MEKIAQLGAAAGLTAVGIAMVLYESRRIKAKRPIANGGDAVQLYWIGYLSLFVIAFTLIVAAIIR